VTGEDGLVSLFIQEGSPRKSLWGGEREERYLMLGEGKNSFQIKGEMWISMRGREKKISETASLGRRGVASNLSKPWKGELCAIAWNNGGSPPMKRGERALRDSKGGGKREKDTLTISPRRTDLSRFSRSSLMCGEKKGGTVSLYRRKVREERGLSRRGNPFIPFLWKEKLRRARKNLRPTTTTKVTL